MSGGDLSVKGAPAVDPTDYSVTKAAPPKVEAKPEDPSPLAAGEANNAKAPPADDRPRDKKIDAGRNEFVTALQWGSYSEKDVKTLHAFDKYRMASDDPKSKAKYEEFMVKVAEGKISPEEMGKKIDEVLQWMHDNEKALQNGDKPKSEPPIG